MSEINLQIMIPILTLVISVISSILITSLRNRTELKKIRTDLEQKYAKSLFDKRIELYPELYGLLSSFSKTMQYDQLNIEKLIEFRESVDSWDSKYSIFFTQTTRKICGGFRSFINEKIRLKDISENFIEEMFNKMVIFERALRSELGIYVTKPAGEVKFMGSFKRFRELYPQKEPI